MLVMLVAVFCIPASAELVVYKMTCRERLFDQSQDCPAKEVLAETMWLVIEVDPEELALLECGDSDGVGGDAIIDAAIFKTWNLGREKLYDSAPVDDMAVFVLDDHIGILMRQCGVTSVVFGKISKIGLPRSLTGHMISEGQYIGEGNCHARLNTRLTRMAYEEGWSIGDVLGYLEDKQPKKAEQGNMCDPFD